MLKLQPFEEAPSNLGPALRARRKELGMTMQAVADAAGLSVGFISQIERGLAAPSLSSLAGLAEVLQRPISDFLVQPGADGNTTRQNRRVTYSVDMSGPSYERISTKFSGSQLTSVIVHEPPGRRSEPISHRGEEMFFVLAGEVTVEIEGQAEVLGPGDSIHFDSNRVHSTWNHTDQTVSLLWCGTMDMFGDAPAPIHKNAPENGAGIPNPTGDTP
ncbi:helix-turn-helix domain-containing protein [Rhodophyticola porphyridii]|uniref:helix-turn-helix domain-containing protein n=1 Tax=Rhodophyticola porphyridii TaxID=1852017 RepID=UPI001B1F9D59|nr:cupin domain-containing protein [Roseicyclus sp.]MBO6626579.1 cupin domain-containing protein [Roseicyclus sp.]MBO6922307.1 cupin domain-containing protein [Roseicyclus sp.]